MKWSEMYLQLTISNDQTFPMEMSHVMDRLAMGESFQFVFITDWITVEDGTEEPVFWEEPLNLVIQRIVADAESGLQLTVKTKGVLPQGLKHGVYVLQCGGENHSMFSDPFVPPEMLEDGNVPADIIHDLRANKKTEEENARRRRLNTKTKGEVIP